MCGKISKLMVKYPLSSKYEYFLFGAGLSDDVDMGTMHAHGFHCNCIVLALLQSKLWVKDVWGSQESVEFEPENSSGS